MKARPISPGTKHPMRRLLGKAGRAWYFAVHNLKMEHLKQVEVLEVPSFLSNSWKEMAKDGEKVSIDTFDIEGCFPNTPKNAIRIATDSLIQHIKKLGHDAIWVPTKGNCDWKEPKGKMKGRGTWIPLNVIRELIFFALENTYLKMPNGIIVKQTLGIPMGDPLSPGMCIGSCAWMENEWLYTIITSLRANRKRGARN